VTRSKHGRTWGAFTVLLAGVFAAFGCQDGYPIEPTSCDRYCALELAPECVAGNPTECVVFCETTFYSRLCPTEFDDWVGCLKAQNRRRECNDSVTGKTVGCESESQALYACVMRGTPTPSDPE